MPVYIHLANLILPKEIITKKYVGGIIKFKQDFNFGNAEYHQEDGELISLASFNIDEFDLDKLILNGLHFDETKTYSTDFVLVSRYGGCAWPVYWLQENNIYAWHYQCPQYLVKKAQAFEEVLMSDLEEAFKRGENPFGIIK